MAAPFDLRPYLPRDARAVAALFRASIEELAAEEYSPAQCEAWAARADDAAAFGARLAGLTALVALADGKIAAFAALKENEQLEFLYTHPEFAGRGAAKMLCAAVEALARGRKSPQIIVAASDCAQGFFARRGYVPLQRNSVLTGEEWLANTTMRKEL